MKYRVTLGRIVETVKRFSEKYLRNQKAVSVRAVFILNFIEQTASHSFSSRNCEQNRSSLFQNRQCVQNPDRRPKNEKGRGEPDLPLSFRLRQYIRGRIPE